MIASNGEWRSRGNSHIKALDLASCDESHYAKREEFLISKRDGHTIFSFLSDRLLAIALHIKLAACSPISNAGCVMVVNGGDKSGA